MVMRALLLGVLSLFSSIALAQPSLTAELARHQVYEGDMVQLTVTLHGEQANRQQTPDFSVLEADFDVLGSATRTQTQIINFKREVSSQWVLTLLPKRTGKLSIPPLHYGTLISQPLSIEVSAKPEALRQQARNRFFVETELLYAEHPYVHGQWLYRERVYFNLHILHNDFPLLTVDGADVQLLTPNGTQYQTEINQRTFRVFERQYSITPERAGDIVLPARRFSARSQMGEWFQDVVAEQRIAVRPIPDSFPANAMWLPARQVTLSERFDQDTAPWYSGNFLNRTLSLHIQGGRLGEEPNLLPKESASVRAYPTPAQSYQDVTNQGISVHWQRSVALLANEPGSVTLPEIRIPWWNVVSDRLEYAVLDAHNLTVLPAANAASAQLIAPEAARISEKEHLAPPVTQLPRWGWGLIGGLACALILSLSTNIWFGWRLRKTLAESPALPTSSTPKTQPNWQAVTKACQSNDASTIREAILNWANQWPTPATPLCLSEVAKRLKDERVHLALTELDALLFSAQPNSVYNGQVLLGLLTPYRNGPVDKEHISDRLYPT